MPLYGGGGTASLSPWERARLGDQRRSLLSVKSANTTSSSGIRYSSRRSLGRRRGQNNTPGANMEGVWGIMYVNDGGFPSRLSERLARIMTIVLKIFVQLLVCQCQRRRQSFLIRALEKKPTTEVPPQSPQAPLVIHAAGWKYAETTDFDIWWPCRRTW